MFYLKSKIKNYILQKSYELQDEFPFSSLPYITGDGFRGIANYIINENGINSLFHSNEKNIFFCEVKDLYLIKRYINLINNNILIIHNGDDAPDMNLRKLLNHNLIKLYSTNIIKVFDNETCIPIGLENAKLKKSGSFNYYFNLNNNNIKKSELVFASFNVGTNTSERLPLLNLCKYYDIENEYGLSLLNYRKRLLNAKFILSPPGNGIDCHRTWEAIYHKSVPVILRKYCLFNEHSLPILVVKKYEDFLNLNDDDKQKIYDDKMSYVTDLAFMPYWYKQILNLNV